MLEKYLKAGIDFNRINETLEIVESGTREMGLATHGLFANHETKATVPDVAKEARQKIKIIFTSYKEVYPASSLWADKQTKVMQELRNRSAKQANSDELNTTSSGLKT